jgi:dihydroflavonol-4-reductase
MKIFITGATGFIGSHLLQALNGKGQYLKCLVRNTSNVENLLKHNCELVYGDVTDKASVLKGMKGSDWVVNLANVYSMWEQDTSTYFKVNIEGTRNVMESALEAEIKKIVHISTVAIFGNCNDCPITENSRPGTKRFSEYAETKYEGDKIAWDFFEKKHLPLVVLYPAAVLGPGDTQVTGQYIRLLINRKMPALGFTRSILTWVHVKDVANAIVKALEKPDNIGAKYLIGKEHFSIGKFNKMISEISGVKLPIIELPGWMALINAYLLTIIADFIKKPPLWGMAMDLIKNMKVGFKGDGSKAEKELGIQYSPAKAAIREMLISI